MQRTMAGFAERSVSSEPPSPEQQRDVLDRLVARLTAEGLPSAWYMIPGHEGFGAITGGEAIDVHCLEARLGPAPGAPGYTSYAVAQTFLARYPSLALTLLVELADADRRPGTRPARFSLEIDRKFSLHFLPAMFSGLNELDPAGLGRGQLVQSYRSSEVTPADFLHAGVYSAWLLTRYRRCGQRALIAVDYHDPISRWIASAMKRLRGLVPDIHLIARTETPSTLRIALRGTGGDVLLLDGSSTALDEGIALARAYLDARPGAARAGA